MSLRMVLLLLFLLLLLLCCCRSCCSHGCPLSIGTRGEEASTSSRGVAIRSSESGHRSLRAGAPKTRRELRSGTPGWTRGPGCSGRCQPPTHRGTQAARAHEGVPMYSASVFLRILVPMSRMRPRRGARSARRGRTDLQERTRRPRATNHEMRPRAPLQVADSIENESLGHALQFQCWLKLELELRSSRTWGA
ncbi:unnamed protein product [Prorocentrum cordatum]|uniref:Secreted protein n=1 Tax=Prorocentrum cordatum TaxID=2364126 RepID=A0ABN9X9B2_9DINO|nr:unnamed protein product [Polarella glacialis]